jgi:hypothetical protein
MKTADTQTTSAAQTQTQSREPFFNKNGNDALFGKTASPEPFFSPKAIQPKLKIGKPNDIYEQQADAVADQVVQKLTMPQAAKGDAAPAPPLGGGGGIGGGKTNTPSVQNKCTDCANEDKLQKNEEDIGKSGDEVQLKPIFDSASDPPEDTVQRQCADCEKENTLQKQENIPSESASTEGEASPDISARLSSSKGGGSPLPHDTRTSMESAMGADFSNVRIHTGSEAAQMSQDLNAQAFTHGSDVYFNEGKYNTNSPDGKRLLAHELTHTIQQNSVPIIQRRKFPNSSLQPKADNSHTPNIQLSEDNSPGFFQTIGNTIRNTASGLREGINNVVGLAQDAASGLINTIRSAITEGVGQLQNVWQGISEFAETAINELRTRTDNILSLFMSPISLLVNALRTFNADSLLAAWNSIKNFAVSSWTRVVNLFQSISTRVQSMWNGIQSLANSFFSLLSNYTSNPLFEFLRSAWQTIIRPLQIIWNSIRQGWTALYNWMNSTMQDLTERVGRFIQFIVNFSIDSLVESFRRFGRAISAIQQAVNNPMPLVTPIIQWIVTKLQDTPDVAIEKAGSYFTNKGTTNEANPSISGKIMRQEQDEDSAPRVRSRVGWSEFWSGVWRHIVHKFRQISLWDVVVDTLWTLLWPWPGVWQDLTQMVSSLGQTADSLYSSDSWQGLWSNILRILDFPIIIWRTINSILGRLWGWLFIASVIAGAFPGSAIGGFLASVIPGLGTAVGGVGGGLLGAGAGAGFALAAGIPLLKSFLLAEGVNIARAILSLTTGLSTQDEKERDFGRIAESALGLAAAGILFLLTAAAARLGATLMNFARRFIPNVVAGAEEFAEGVREGFRRTRRGRTPVVSGRRKIIVDNPNRITNTRPTFNSSTNQWEWALIDRETSAQIAYQHTEPPTVPNSGPEMTLTPHEATIPTTGEVVSLTSRGFSWTEISIRRMIEVYESLFGHRPGNLPGNIAWDNLANFQREFVRLRTANPSLGEQEIANSAIRNISFGRHRIAAGYSDINVTVESRGTVEIDGHLHENVPDWVRIDATPPRSH